MSNKNPYNSQWLYDVIKDICIQNDCGVEQLAAALQSNVVREQISIQIHYEKTGELPE